MAVDATMNPAGAPPDISPMRRYVILAVVVLSVTLYSTSILIVAAVLPQLQGGDVGNAGRNFMDHDVQYSGNGGGHAADGLAFGAVRTTEPAGGQCRNICLCNIFLRSR